MRIVVTGATGNAGTSVVRALSADERVTEIVGVARRVPRDWAPPRVRWVSADVERDELPLDGADAVIHLAWLIQPSHDDAELERVNVLDMGLAMPVMDIRRAREELGWAPRVSSVDALRELVAGMRGSAGGETPPLGAQAGGPARVGAVRRSRRAASQLAFRP